MMLRQKVYTAVGAISMCCLASPIQAETPLADPCKSLHLIHRASEVRVPFEVEDGRIFVKARVNGRGNWRFAVDSGASGFGRADSSLVSALGLPLVRTTSNSDGIQSAPANVTRLGRLSLGRLTVRNVDVITRDYNGGRQGKSKISGILGRAFFAEGLLLIDHATKTLSFSRKVALSPDGNGVMRYERAFRVPVTVAGISTLGNLDTGANVNFVMPKTLFDKISVEAPVPAGDGTLSNTTIKTSRARISGPIRVGNMVFNDVEARISDRFPELLVGAHAFLGKALLIDQRNQAVALCAVQR